jgi:hypothetical protein
MVDKIPLRAMAYSLSPLAVGDPITRPERSVPVRVWVHTADGDSQVEGEAAAWSPKAVHVRYFDQHGREGFVWVWASAVTRL